ncbi:MAG: MurR/RpiR family transcriptional regulator [Clostridia bacterium]|nr:MurR/RpiR family transcriptional regulator [Clostridia bacterium]
MSHLNFKNRLQYYGMQLSKSEQKIADFIIKHHKEVVLYSSDDLAQKNGTSKSTISRFCKKLGYRNYNEFLTLLSSENEPQPLIDDPVQKIMHYCNQVYLSSSELIDINVLNQFIHQIKSANQILICGIGSSGLTAIELSMRLVHMGLVAKAITDSHLMKAQTQRFSSKDLLIAISTSGTTQEVIEACNIAKEIGTPICAITKTNYTPLTNLSETTIFVSDVSQINDPQFINSQLSFLYLIDILSYILLLDPEYSDNFNKFPNS